MGPMGPGGVPTSLMQSEGHALVQRYLKAMHKSPVINDKPSPSGDSGFLGGMSNY